MTLTSAPEQRAAQGLEPPAAPAARRGGAFALRWGGRLLGALVTLWGAATVAFLAQLALPGDRATVIFNIRAGQAIERTPEELASINEQFGLQRPAWQQYVEFLGGLLRGDLGDSYQQFRPVAALIAEQLPSTLALTALALLFAWIIMVLWVTLTAGRAPWLSSVGAVIDTVAAGLPHYWLGILLLVVFAAGLGWFPVISGDKPAGIVLPALTLAIPLAGFMGQSTRTEYENTLKQPFVTTARLRGLSDTSVRLRHVLRHAMLPAVTLSGWAVGATLSGAVVVEALFSRRGVGSLLVTAVNQQDLPVVTGVVILTAAIYVLVNLAVDAAYSLIDPRLKAS